jgi:large exoprotein involved in heme utilization and adhesion
MVAIAVDLFYSNLWRTSNISIKASDSVTIDGHKNPGAETGVITDVKETGSGTAGGITIQTPKLILTDRGRITASTVSGDGGNVTLKDIRLLLMRRNSQISATASPGRSSGDGGNIIISAEKGFIIAVPSENNDIKANAYSGAGGRVTIQPKPLAIIGIKERKTGTDSTSDITASSEFGRQGIISIDVPTADPGQGLTQISREPRDRVVADSCQVSNGEESVRFFDIGRGGLPPRPEDPLSVDLLEWGVADSIPSPHVSSIVNWTPKQPIVTTALRLVPPCQSR